MFLYTFTVSRGTLDACIFLIQSNIDNGLMIINLSKCVWYAYTYIVFVFIKTFQRGVTWHLGFLNHTIYIIWYNFLYQVSYNHMYTWMLISVKTWKQFRFLRLNHMISSTYVEDKIISKIVNSYRLFKDKLAWNSFLIQFL